MAADDALDTLIDAMAPALGIPIDPAWRADVRTHLDILLRTGEMLTAQALPDDTEPAPVFVP